MATNLPNTYPSNIIMNSMYINRLYFNTELDKCSVNEILLQINSSHYDFTEENGDISFICLADSGCKRFVKIIRGKSTYDSSDPLRAHFTIVYVDKKSYYQATKYYCIYNSNPNYIGYGGLQHEGDPVPQTDTDVADSGWRTSFASSGKYRNPIEMGFLLESTGPEGEEYYVSYPLNRYLIRLFDPDIDYTLEETLNNIAKAIATRTSDGSLCSVSSGVYGYDIAKSIMQIPKPYLYINDISSYGDLNKNFICNMSSSIPLHTPFYNTDQFYISKDKNYLYYSGRYSNSGIGRKDYVGVINLKTLRTYRIGYSNVYRFIAEDSEGYVYGTISSSASSSKGGFVKLRYDTTETVISNSGTYYMILDDNNNVYFCDYIGTTVGYYQKDTNSTTYIKVFSSNVTTKGFAKDSKGNIYLTTTQGIWLMQGTSDPIQITTYPAEANTLFYEDPQGRLLFSGLSSGSTSTVGGIVCVDNSTSPMTASKIVNSNVFHYIHTTTTGEIYLTGRNVKGIYKLEDNNTLTQVFTSDTGDWAYMFEASNGTLYFSRGANVSNELTSGICKGTLSESSRTWDLLNYPKGIGYKYFFEDHYGNIFVSNGGRGVVVNEGGSIQGVSQSLYQIKSYSSQTEPTIDYVGDAQYKYFKEIPGEGIIISDTEYITPNSNCGILWDINGDGTQYMFSPLFLKNR